MRVGVVILPQQRWSEAAPLWRGVEDMGFDHAWTYDHLAWRSLADQPWFATVPTLVAAATVTTTVRLGTWVASPNYRHPVPFAKELMSLDDISGGRFLLGVGAGGTGVDATVLGDPAPAPATRTARFAEFVELLDALLTQPVTTWRGEHFAAEQARMLPGRDGLDAALAGARLPFVVAANGPRAMAVAARFGQGWATTGVGGESAGEQAWWRDVEARVARFDEVAREAGRDPDEVDRYLSLDTVAYSLRSVGAFEDAVGRAAELGFTDVVVHWPRPNGVYAGREDVLEAVAARLPSLRGS